MNSLVNVTLHQAFAACAASTQGDAQTEHDLFHARARALRKQQPGRLAAWFKALIWAPVAARIAAKRAERDLLAHFGRLENLSGHLLGDIGIERVGLSDYVVRTDNFDAVRAFRLANVPLLAERLPPPLRHTPDLVAA